VLKFPCQSSRRFVIAGRGVLLVLASQWLLAACTVVGPSAIHSGRLAYNAAISETNNQQMLMVLVNNRYGESNHLLNIASVTANVSVSSSGSIQAGFGSKSNYEGGLVPFTGGVVYEENPTISYVPVTGEKYFRQISTPVSVDVVARLVGTRYDPLFIYLALVNSVNDIRNAPFLFNEQTPDLRFTEFTGLMTELSRSHNVRWYAESPQGPGFVISSRGASSVQSDSLETLLGLIGLSAPNIGVAPLYVPVVAGISAASDGALRIETRSMLQLLEIMSSCVEVPANDVDSGVASSFPRGGGFADLFRVRYASSKPESAYVAVEHRKGWFYIHEEDQNSKLAFKLLESLWSAAMSNTLDTRHSAPLLTVPVSR
jgi:hypothetical protein